MSKTTLQNQPGFFISHTFNKAWQIFKKQPLQVWGIMLLPIGLAILYMIINNTLPEGILRSVLWLAYMIVQCIVGMGVTKIFLKMVRGENYSINDAFSTGSSLINYILGTLLYAVIVIGGMILLIFPGIIWGIKYMFMPYLIIDKGMSPLEAMKKSGELTQGAKWDLVGYFYTTVIMIYLGVFALVVGLAVTIPITTLSYVIVYDLLLKRGGQSTIAE